MSPLLSGDAIEQARLIASGEACAAELVSASIAAIEKRDGAINAVVARRFEAALREAQSPQPGPFSGVPILLKELTPYPDWPSTSCAKPLAHAPGGQKNELVRRIESAGFIVIGRTNASEFGALPITDNALYGATRNPWSPGLDAGGSSGGAAAAVMAGFVAIAQAGDWGGSIRIPSAACGAFGLKPSRGRVSAAPGLNTDGFGAAHAITTSVRDSAAFLDVTQGALSWERWQAEDVDGLYLNAIETAPPRLRVGLCAPGFLGYGPAHRDHCAAVMSLGVVLQDLGHDVVNIDVPCDRDAIHEAFKVKTALGLYRARRAARAQIGDDAQFTPWTEYMASLAEEVPGWADADASDTLAQASASLCEMFETYDLILTPVTQAPPPPHGWLDLYQDAEAAFAALIEYAPHTPLINAAGLPAASIPWGSGATRLPVGVQIIAGPSQDRLLLQAARCLELAAPWARRAPGY